MLYRDSENGVIRGVCAGVAHSLDLNRGTLRIIMALSLMIFTIPTVLVYFIVGALLRDRPLHIDAHRERQFWRNTRAATRDANYRY